MTRRVMGRRCRSGVGADNAPRAAHTDVGSGAAEFVIVVPVLCLCLLFVVWCGRLGESRNKVELAAGSGARAASMVRRTRMESVGASAALASIARNGASCDEVSAGVEVFERYVRVEVTCVTNASDLGDLGSRRLVAAAVAPIDRYRSEMP